MNLYEKWIEHDRVAQEAHIYNSVFSTVVGGIVGDALGLPFEFKNRNTFKAIQMEDNGTYNQKEGTWSDDTALTLCLIETIIENQDENFLMTKFVDYMDNAYWTPYGKVFDIGRTTQQAILKYKSGENASNCGGTDENSNGNGSLMRIAPIVFLLKGDFNFSNLIQLVEKYSKITHSHPRSIVGCIIFIAILFRMYHQDDLETAIKMTSELCKDNLINTPYKEELKYYNRILDGKLKSIKVKDIKSTGYIVDTLEAALWSCLNAKDFKDALLLAVNLGGDTDTIASIAGNIAGMQYQDITLIPEQWLNKLARKNDINKLLEKFSNFLSRK